jgi:WD40 repeat protein
VRLWDVRQPDRKPIELVGHSGWVWAVAFTADGESLVSGGADRSVRVWPTRSPPLADAICASATRDLTAEEWGEYLPADVAWEATCP